MIMEEPSVHVEIMQSVSGANVSLRIIFEFSTFTTTELVEIIDYEMSLITLGGISLVSSPPITIFESTGMCLPSLHESLQILHFYTYVCVHTFYYNKPQQHALAIVITTSKYICRESVSEINS